jgi:hypothetical protein
MEEIDLNDGKPKNKEMVKLLKCRGALELSIDLNKSEIFKMLENEEEFLNLVIKIDSLRSNLYSLYMLSIKDHPGTKEFKNYLINSVVEQMDKILDELNDIQQSKEQTKQ